MAKLYVIATPIGNRQDITLRALEVLKGLTHLFAEDTREAAKLLELHAIEHHAKKLHSYANHNLKGATEKAIELLREGHDLGVVSDRGTPGISDPGALLVRRAREEGYEVVPLPGPSSVTALVSASGWDASPFVFYGFWPTGSGESKRLLEAIGKHRMVSCFLESAQRVRGTVAQWAEAFPQGKVCWGREMTKTFEEFRIVSLAELAFESMMEKGEYTLLLDPGSAVSAEAAAWEEEVKYRLASEKEWAKWVGSRYGVASKDVYNALQKEKL